MILKLWLIGMVVAIMIGVITWKSENPKKIWCYTNKKIWCYMMLAFSTITAGGILDGTINAFLLYVAFQTESLIVRITVMIVVPSIVLITYGVGYLIVGLCKIEERILNVCFAIILIIATVGWTFLFYNENKIKDENTEIVTETKVETEERRLISFCKLPVQNVSGSIEGSSQLGTGNVSGIIETIDELPYWYLDESGEGNYDVAPATNSKLIFFEDNTTIPHLEIITSITWKKYIYHYNGTEWTEMVGETTEYRFYLPATMKSF